MKISITDKFIDLLYDVSLAEFSDSVIIQAKRCLLDYVGVTLAGAKILQQKGNRMLDFLESDCHGASVIGFKRKTNLYHAAMVNGMSAHIAELDDGSRQGSVHPGAPIISALLSLTEIKKLNGKDLLKGIIVGYEVAIRLASAIQPSHRNKGYHATGTCGSIGVAFAVAAALGYNKLQYKQVLSAAATSSSGMLNITKGKSELKPYNAGQAAVSGLISAIVAHAGFMGAENSLDGEWGFLNMHTDNCNYTNLEKPSRILAIENVYFKPYAACRHCHPAIEAALILKKEHNINPSQIEKINIITYDLATNGHDHTSVEGITSAKLSIPFSVAVALITSSAGLNEFTDTQLKDAEILELTKKIKVTSDYELNSLVPQKRPAIVEIIINSNITYIKRIDLAKGEPENPLTKDEITDKFLSLSLFAGKTEEEAKNISSIIWEIETEVDKLIKVI